MKKNLIKIALDTIPVILGVLIALFVSDLREESSNKKYLKTVFNSIELEIKDNRDDLKSVLQKQNRLLDTINHYLNEESISLTQIIIKSKGLQLVTMQNTSWKNLLGSKIELVDYNVFSKLSEIEGSSGLMKLKIDKMMDFLYENIESTDNKSKKLMLIHLTNMIDSEESLLEMHEKYLEIDK